MVATANLQGDSGFPPSQALYLADANGGNVRQLTGFGYLIRPPILWSPDGTSLLFLRSREYIPSYRFVVRVAAGGGPATEISPRGFGGHPSWSHDGSLIALNQSPISVINAADGTVVLALRGTSARFSPVRNEFAFNAWPLDSAQHIHLIRTDSTADRDLRASGSPTSWSPDGSWLAFETGTRNADGRFIVQTWVIRPDGSGLARIGPVDADVSGVAWSADGHRIAYIVRTSFSDPGHIEIARPDGSDARSLVTSGPVCCLSWWPQGSN
jgi:Tol biopolymer transport system component